MESFWVAARVVVPMALMMLIGVLLRVGKITDRDTMKKVDKISFNLFLPMLMFQNTYNMDFSQITGGYIFYALGGCFATFLVVMLVIPRFEKNPPSAGALGNALIRTNYMMYATAIASNLYGDANLGPIMLLGAVIIPWTNALGAILLEVARSEKASGKKLLITIAKNPLVIAAVLGLAVNFSGVAVPSILQGVVKDIAGLATPIGFLSLGVGLNLSTVAGNKKRLTVGLILKLIVFPVVIMSGALALGFRGMELCGLLVVFCAPPAVASYPMAVAMDADAELAGQMVIFPTILSLFTIFLWILGLNGAGLLAI